MFKTFFKKASISFVFALILGCGCGKDNLFATTDMATNGHSTNKTIEDQINDITNSTQHNNDQKCDALKNLHATHKNHAEAAQKIQSAINTLDNCSLNN